jgi:hypothetical protein
MRQSHPLEICPRWDLPSGDGYRNFLDDLGEPEINFTLVRLDSSKMFSPDNCEWAPWVSQKKGGRPKNPASLRQRAIAAGLPPGVVSQRVHKLKWPEAKALSTPIAQHVPIPNTAPNPNFP